MFLESYTLFYEDHIYLNNYGREGVSITYEELANYIKSVRYENDKVYGFVTLKLENDYEYDMFVFGAHKDKKKELEIRKQIKEFVNRKCGMKVL